MSDHGKAMKAMSKFVDSLIKAKKEKGRPNGKINKLILLIPTHMSFLSFTRASTPSDRTARRMS